MISNQSHIVINSVCVLFVTDWTKHHNSEELASLSMLGHECADATETIIVTKSMSTADVDASHSSITAHIEMKQLPTLLQEASKHARMGSNLGLPICLRLAAAMHGSVGLAEVRCILIQCCE